MKSLAYSLIALLFPFVVEAQDAFRLDKEYDINLNGKLQLNTDDADIRITGSNRTTAHVKIFREIKTKGLVWGEDNFSVDVEMRNGDLIISERSNGSHISVMGYMSEEYTIDISLPLGVNLDLDGDDDDYIIKDMKGAIYLNLDDGDAKLTNCTGSEFKFNLDDGDIEMDGGNGSLEVKLDDGDIEITNASFSQINASVDDGDLIIGTDLQNNGSYVFKADDSDIILNINRGGGEFSIDHDDSRLFTAGSFETLEKDEDYTRLRLGNGTAEIKMRVDDATVRLNN